MRKKPNEIDNLFIRREINGFTIEINLSGRSIICKDIYEVQKMVFELLTKGIQDE